MTNNICFSSSVVRFISHLKLKSGFPPSLFRKVPVTGVERIGGQRRTRVVPWVSKRHLSSEFPGAELPQRSE